MKKVGEEIKSLETHLKKIEAEYSELMLAVPNMTHPDAPDWWRRGICRCL